MKVPPHLWEATVAFYRDVVGLAVVERAPTVPPSVCFAFGANHLWVDRVDAMSQAELWLELTTDDVGAAAAHLAAAGVVRRDEIEPLPGGFPGFWVQNPASIIHMVKRHEPPDEAQRPEETSRAAPGIDGFDYRTITATDGVRLRVAVAGQGSPILLLHGFPQTHLMWRHVAPALARMHTVICPDLRGYGASDKPVAASPDTYAKRTMARDAVDVARALGFERFAVVGHDRGALVAFRAGLDHPDVVTHVGALDVLPTLDMWGVLRGADAPVAWHLYLMAQPPGLPERMIGAAGEAFFAAFLDGWGADAQAIPPDVRAAYLEASAAAVPSIVADYRASATIDVVHDRADRAAGRRLTMPTTVVQQDWGAQLGFDAAALWRAWAADLDHRTLNAGHFMAEQAPDAVLEVITSLMARGPAPAA